MVGVFSSFHRYRVFLELAVSTMDEIRGDRDLSGDEKEVLVSLLKDVMGSARMTIGILENKGPKELFGLGKSVVSEESENCLDNQVKDQPKDLYEEYL